MKTSWSEIFLIVVGIILLSIYTLPWKHIGVTMPVNLPDYKLGLDLNGGVELDYQVDLEEAKKRKSADFNEANIVESLKKIIEKRVNSLGTAEPNIQTASYGNEKHIIVQIPTISFAEQGLTPEELRAKNDEYVQKAKATIGKVVRLEFKEERTPTDADKAARKDIALAAQKELAGKLSFDTIATKYQDSYEGVSYKSGVSTLKNLPSEVSFSGIASISAPMLSDVVITQKSAGYSEAGYSEADTGYSLVKIEKVENKMTASGSQKMYTYKSLFVSQQPSQWAVAKTKTGEALDERYLLRAGMIMDQMGQPEVELSFNKEGAAIFAELTGRLIGKRMAIFVGGQKLTDPMVNSVIPNGKAVITGSYTMQEAKELANNINTGIVPAPIYLTSERTIDAKIGADALGVIAKAGVIGFLVILAFLVWAYRIGGLLAGIALVAYTLMTIAVVRASGMVLTLASIAGLVLSVGLAIDANILIFERTKEMLRKKVGMLDSIDQGFDHSWSAIWDSHVTTFVSAAILYVFGVSIIKGFGFMLGIGVLISLFSAMYISRVLILFVAEHFNVSNKVFVGLSTPVEVSKVIKKK